MAEFSRLLLIACACIALTSILYFFYWNRFIGFIIGRVIRILYWNQEGSSIWVEIGSIHFSILTGRILLKDVRYHSSNQTIKIVTGKIQWRYWTRRPTSEEDLSSIRGEDAKDSTLLSCRIQLSFQGLEWFIYNRTAAYDDIVDQMERNVRPGSRSSSHRRFFTRFTRQENPSLFRTTSFAKSAIRMPSIINRAMAWFKQQMPTLDPKDLLPLGIDVQTGAIILGNPSTPNLLVAEFQSVLGTYSTTQSRSKCDFYKQVLSMKFRNNHVRFLQNDDYVDPMATMGELVHNGIRQHPTFRRYVSYRSYRSFMKLWRQVGLYKLVVDYFTTRRAQRRDQSSATSSIPYLKPKKTAEEDTPPGLDFSDFEYAVERRILEAPVLELTYYVDVVGDVLSHSIPPRYSESGIHDVGNGDTDPEWGFDVAIYDAVLRYGPWADRQRTELQRAFFPPTYQDSETTPRLKPGDKRTWTSLQVFIELREDTTLQVPFREASKDWQWDGIVEVPQRPRKREAATLNIVVADRSSINYRLPMVTGPNGYEATLEVHLDAMTMTSSLNDVRLVSSESARIRCELPTPLGWDVERAWLIALYLRQPSLFLLRDHINMLTDLGKDWSSGPPTDYQKFIPMEYIFRLEMHHFDLNLYANDQNIVDKPLVKEENALVNVRGPHLKTTTSIPLNKFRSEFTTIGFDIAAPDLALDISLPRWNIHALQLSSGALNLIKTSLFKLSGSYMYYAEVHEENIEQLKLDFNLQDPTYYAYGWSIRYFMILRDNYIGSFTHFQTLYEYLDKRKQQLPVGDPIKLKYRPGKANMLEARLSVLVTGVQVIQPVNLMGPSYDLLSSKSSMPSAEAYQIVLTVPEIQVLLRMHDYYMDMSLNIDTITGSIKRTYFGTLQERLSTSSEVLLVDGIDITANRLFGPQPRTATYVCIWEISVGNVKGSFSANEVQLMAAAGNSFRMNFTDLLNAPAEEFLPTLDLDVTFYKITTQGIEVTLKAGNAALLIRLSEGIKFDSNDLGAHQYRRVVSIRVPRISGNILLTNNVGRNSWLEAAGISGDAYMDIYSSPVGHRLITRSQLAFIEEQDKLTHRAKLMFNQLRQRTRFNSRADRTTHKSGVYLPQPTLPNTTPRLPGHTMSQRGSVPFANQTPSKFAATDNLSESEGEEWVSEADRDARLARTRTSTPVTHRPEDEITQSSMDESDDADMTDDESSGEEWSDVDDSSRAQPTSSLMTFYSPIVRHYAFNWGHDIRSWDIPAFSQTKAGDPFLRFDHPENISNSAPGSSSFNSPEDIPKNEDVTTMRIKFIKAVRAVFNPLLFQAVASFTDDIANNPSNPALHINSLLGRAVSKASTIKATKCTVMDVELPFATLQVMQHIAMSDVSHPDVSEAMQSTSIPSNLDVVSVTTCNVGDLRLGGVFGQNWSTLKLSVQQIATVMNMPIDKRSIPSDATEPDIIDLTLSAFSLHLSQCILSSTFDGIAVKIGHRGPGFSAATCLALVGLGSSISERVQALKARHKAAERGIIASILKASELQSIIDPLSTIQPSYLVQSGVPHLLRTDLTFKFFYHLQTCLWNIQGSAFPSNIGDVPLADLISSVEARLALLDPDAFTTEHLYSIDKMFAAPEAGLKRAAQRHINQVSVLFTKITATILDPSGESSSQLSVIDFDISSRWKLSDLTQMNLGNSSSASQTSLRSKSPKMVQTIILDVSLGDANLAISPQLMHFAGHVLRIKKQFSAGSKSSSARRSVGDVSDRNMPSKIYRLQTSLAVHHLRVQAAAENLVLVMGIDGAQATSAILLSHTQILQSMQQSILLDKFYIQGRSPADPTKETDSDILAALDFMGVRVSLILRVESGFRKNLKLILGLENIRLHVPRSALRLYHFVGQWRADYLPGYEAALQTLMSEYNARPIKPLSPTPSRQSRRGSNFQLHAQVNHFEISLQVMHGTWLSWEVHRVISYGQSSGALAAGHVYAFGLQIGSMILNISSATNLKEPPTGSRVKLVLPPISLAGNSDGRAVQTLVLFDYIELKVKPSHWDTLLAVQQKFGQDFNDLVALVQKTRRQESTSISGASSNKINLQYEGHLKMKGFRIGLEGISSTVLLECQDINGEISNAHGWSWDLGLSDLALSLAPRVNSGRRTAFNRNHKSAFVIIDFSFHGSASDTNRDKVLRLSMTKIHAVMQPSSIGEFGDFLDNLQAELLDRQEQRSLELAAFKEKTEHILRTFDVNIGDIQLKKTPWINDLMISISVNNIGVAFPLTYDEAFDLSHHENKKSVATRAFLFSVKSIKFESHRGETGHAIVQYLSFQFISGFRQSSPEDFVAENHQTRNWLLYPEMKAQLRSSTMGASRKIWIKADVTGFILDLDSTISNYVFALIDVYRQGKERVERISTNVPRTPMTAIPPIEIVKPSVEKRYSAIPTSNIFCQLVFRSGKVRLYSLSAGQLFKTNILASSNFTDITDEQILALGAEVFNLPVVSVWSEYRATPASQKLRKDGDREPSVLMFNSTVFSSQNTLRPSLLPFLTELINHIEIRMRKASPRALRPPLLLSRPSASSLEPKDEDTGTVSSMQISFSLRIDKSTLELTCQPDVNVVAGLHWESGGFVVNVSPGARKVSFFGSVGGLTIGLKHGFLSEDCVKLDARNLTFSVAFVKVESEQRQALNSISVVFDTEFLGAVRFSRLQDILCFKAVWLDRIPVFNNQSAVEPKTPAHAIATWPAEQSQNGFSTVILLRIRRIQLDVDFGQSITKIKLELHQSVFQTKLTDDLKEVLLHIGDVSIMAQGNMSGHANVSSCVFQTIRRSEDVLRANHNRSNMLELRLTSGSLSVTLDSDHQQLLLYRAKPLEVEILDDWSKISEIEDKSRPLYLSFNIKCSEIIAIVTVGTIPKLLSYRNKFKANLDSQRQGASRESQTFRVSRTPKPNNPLSAVAEAMLHSARLRFKEPETDPYVIKDHLSLQLDLLRLIVFPRSMRDTETAQFIGQDVRARLGGVVSTNTSAIQRDLRLSFSSMVISKYTQVAHAIPTSLKLTEDQDLQDWLSALFKNSTEAIIVGLPSMKMHMISEETQGLDRVLYYNFFSQFVRREGMKAFEDIYITLNMSLYSWLTILRKNLTREMEQVRATEDWRMSIGAASNAMHTGPQRKKNIPDPLVLSDSPRSATLPSGGLSAFSPSPSRLGWIEHAKSPLVQASPSPLQLPSYKETSPIEEPPSQEPTSQEPTKRTNIIYRPGVRRIERLTMRQLGEATPDVMHPFFMKKAGFNLEDSLPQYVNEYAAQPLDEILEVLLKLYSQQLVAGMKKS